MAPVCAAIRFARARVGVEQRFFPAGWAGAAGSGVGATRGANGQVRHAQPGLAHLARWECAQGALVLPSEGAGQLHVHTAHRHGDVRGDFEQLYPGGAGGRLREPLQISAGGVLQGMSATTHRGYAATWREFQRLWGRKWGWRHARVFVGGGLAG